jgi:alpha-glucosidase
VDAATGSEWWRRAVVYQVYPRSFQDSTGAGIGDLQGIIDRLDYLNDGTERSLGIDAIWLSPTFPSPMKDFGYDVSDYQGVHPDFGSLETMDRLIAECHRRGIKILLDYVPNHTSSEHPWFLESRSSRASPKRDWYIWRDATPDGSLPNNWYSIFGGPAWELDPLTGQYYLHSFLVEQPDLNWRNPEVVAAMHDVLRFWLVRGIDGFRIDVMGMVVKHPALVDNPPNPRWTDAEGEHRRLLPINNLNYPDVFPAVKGIRNVLDAFGETMAVGEVFGTARQIGEFYGGADLGGLHLAFNFQLIHERGEVNTPWDAEAIRRIVGRAEADLPRGAQPCYALGNHDCSRFVSRNDKDGRGRERARAAILLLVGLRSTPFIYYGEEIGMTDVDIPEHLLQDPARLRTNGRDPERTPMQWTGEHGRGFTTGTPWLPFGEAAISVAAQEADDDSMLNLYRRAIWTRKREESIQSGMYREVEAPPGVFAFVRHAAGHAPVFVAISTSIDDSVVVLPAGYSKVLLATERQAEGRFVEGDIMLPGLAAIMIAGSSPHAV